MSDGWSNNPSGPNTSGLGLTRTATRESRLRAVVADDSVLLREGVARILREAGVDVVGQAGDAADLLRKARAHKPDVVVVDVRMPPTHTSEGLEAAKKIREELPGTSVLVLSQYAESLFISELVADNASSFGYLMKGRIVDVAQFIDAFHRVADGGSAIDPELVSRMLGRKTQEHTLDSLTPREIEVLAMMSEGRSNRAIADRLTVSVRAIEKHIGSIFSKLNLDAEPDDHRRVLAVLKFLERE